MHDAVGAVVHATVRVAQARVSRVHVQVSDGHELGWQTAHSHEHAGRLDLEQERVTVQRESGNEVAEQVAAATVQVGPGDERARPHARAVRRVLDQRQLADRRLDDLHAAKYGGQRQRVMRRGQSRRQCRRVRFLHVVRRLRRAKQQGGGVGDAGNEAHAADSTARRRATPKPAYKNIAERLKTS